VKKPLFAQRKRLIGEIVKEGREEKLVTTSEIKTYK